MSEMSSQYFENNGVNGTGAQCEGASPGRCSPVQQRGPGRHPATARKKWSKEVNIVVMECYFRSKPLDENGVPIKGYRQRMYKEWKERGFFDVSEQRVCDQARAIRKNGWLTELELEMIQRRINGNVNYNEEENNITPEYTQSLDDVTETAEPNNRTELNFSVEEASEEEIDIVNELNEIYNLKENCDGVMFKKVEYKKLNMAIREVNKVLPYFQTSNISETNNLIIAVSVWVARRLGLKRQRQTGTVHPEPWWKRRIERDIKDLQKSINLMTRHKNGEVKSREKIEKLYEKFSIRRKGIGTVLEELKQRVLAKKAKIDRYTERLQQFRQNRLFNYDQKRLYYELNGNNRVANEIPNAEESRMFWNEIWGESKEHNYNAEWLKTLKDNRRYRNQEGLVITGENILKQSRKVPNWKAPGKDGVQGFWVKKLTSLHERIAHQLNEILSGNEQLPQWLTFGRTVLCQKDVTKGNAVDNYRPISCLPIMWKLFTGIMSDYLYDFLEKEKLLPEEQKGCRRKTRGTKDQLLIDKAALKDCKRRHTNLAMAWIDYRKAYDMIPHSWIRECLELFGVADNIKRILSSSMKNWKLELTSSGVSLGEVNIRRGIFQGDSLSPLLFVICMIPLTMVLRKVNFHYELGDKVTKLNHLLFMDDLKLFAKSHDQIDSLVTTVQMFSTDIGMEFGINKCGAVILQRGKIVRSTGVLLPDGKLMKAIDDDGYKYLGILESDKIKENEMKLQFVKEYKRRVRLILKSKLNGKNKIKAINTWAVAVLRYGAGILTWNVEELKELDRKTRKLLTMHKGLHPKSDVDRLYLSRKDGGRGLMSCEHVIRSEENNLGWYLKHSKEGLLQGVKHVGILEFEKCCSKDDFKNAMREKRMEAWMGKQMYSQFVSDMPVTTDKEKTWSWMRKSDLKITTEALICAAQEQAIRTNYIKYNIDKTADSPTCRLCKERGETVSHIVSECKKLAQTDYKRRHDNVAKMIHWRLCEKFMLEKPDQWYEHSPETVSENTTHKLLWDMNIQCDHTIEARRPDIVIIDKVEKSAIIVDVAIPGDKRIYDKEKEKIEKYQDIKREIQRLWSLRKVSVVPVIVGALGSVTHNFKKFMDQIGIELEIHFAQKTTLLGTARILRRVLEY